MIIEYIYIYVCVYTRDLSLFIVHGPVSLENQGLRPGFPGHFCFESNSKEAKMARGALAEPWAGVLSFILPGVG